MRNLEIVSRELKLWQGEWVGMDSKLRYLIIEAHVHTTVQHNILASQGHNNAATTHIYSVVTYLNSAVT